MIILDPEQRDSTVQCLTLNAYQGAARSTALYPPGLIYPTLKLCGEAGEFSEKVGKIIRDFPAARKDFIIDLTDAQRMALRAELGDVLWYAAALAHELGTTLGEIAYDNLVKLQQRKATNTIQGSGDNRHLTASSSNS